MIYTASGTILTCRFVKSSGQGTVAQQTVAGALCLGVSQDGGRYAPTPLNTASPVEAAQSGETVNVYDGLEGGGKWPIVEVGSGGLTAGGIIMSDTGGKGIAATGTGKIVQGIALATGAAGEFIPFKPVCYELN